MMVPGILSLAKKEQNLTYAYKYAICTLVTNFDEYGRMLDSFVSAGFTDQDCEYRYIDNTSGNNLDAYKGLNLFLQNADAEYIILCHQDILLKFDNRGVLEERIAELNALDKSWALLGNAGTNNPFLLSMIITHSDLVTHKVGVLPSKVNSLDEDFILVKKSANIALSGDLSGFHLYGTDICLVASCLGYNAYAVEFSLLHLSMGNKDASFYASSKRLQNKYSYFFRSRYIKTTITRFFLSSNRILRSFMDISLVQNIVRLGYKYKFKWFKKY
jgi:hypothetical protein